MKERKSWQGLLGLAALLCSHVHAAGIQVGSGSLVQWGDAQLHLDCGDLVIDGQANGATAVYAEIFANRRLKVHIQQRFRLGVAVDIQPKIVA